MAVLLAEDRDQVKSVAVLTELLRSDPRHVPAQRLLATLLARTDRVAEFADVLRLQASTFETDEARVGALSDLVLLEEQRGATPRPNELSASQLLLRIAPGDILAHEAIMKRGLTATTSREASALAASVRVIAESTRDELHAAALELGAALLLERTAEERDDHLRHDALRLYRCGARRVARVPHRGARRAPTGRASR